MKRLRHCVIMSLVIVMISLDCAIPAVSINSAPLQNQAKVYMSIYDGMYDQEKKEKTEHDVDRYEQIMQQELQFNPPIKLLLIIPPEQKRYYYSEYYQAYRDSFENTFFSRFEEIVMNNEYIYAVQASTKLFTYNTLDNILEITARYKADQCLFLSYDIDIWQPSFCFNFWPATSLMGKLESYYILLDTRTGFILADGQYSYLGRGLAANSYREQRSNLLNFIAKQWANVLLETITSFYANELEKE